MPFGVHQTSPLYCAQQSAVEIHATLRPDRCRLCKSGIEFQTARRCRECGKMCCVRCRLIDKNRVVCFRCLSLSQSDRKTLMPAQARNARGPTKIDRQALDAEIQAALAAERKQKRAAKRAASQKVQAPLVETCRECGEPVEPGWGDYCLDCGVEWSYGPEKIGVA